MKRILCLVISTLVLVLSVDGLVQGQWERNGRRIAKEDLLGPSEPLILTKYLHDPATARKLSEVHGIGSYMSYTGFFTVNETFGSNMFFWYFPAQSGDAKAPLVMFLQGGPGASSMFGLFAEIGPFKVAPDAKSLIPNPYTWNKEYSMVCLFASVSCPFR